MILSDKKTPHTLVFLCMVLFLDAMGVGLILPVMPALIVELSDLPVSRAAEIGGYLLFAYAAMQFVSAPVLGGLSDRFGRRPVLLVALFGFGLDYFVMAMAPTLLWLFVARLVSGILGATYPAAYACIVDITPPERRARNFGLIGASVGMGFIFGPALGGVLGEYGARLPFIAAGVIAMLACVYGWFVLRETLAPDLRRRFEWRRANPFGALLSVSRYPVVLTILVALFLIQLASQSYNSIWAFFMIERFDWSPLTIGLSVALYGAGLALVQGGLTGPVIARIGEVRATYFSITIGIVVYAGLAFTDQPWLVYFWIIMGSLSGFAFPAMQAMMTKHAPDDAQGELQGAIASSFSLSAILGPLAMTQLFGAFTRQGAPYFPGAPFIGAALLITLSLFAFAYGVKKLPSRQKARADNANSASDG